MYWDNYATYWELDHVQPCSSFDFTSHEDTQKCFNWTNYQPLHKKENLLKSNHIDNNVLEKQKQAVAEFLEIHKDVITKDNENYYILLPVGESPTLDVTVASKNAVN
jgi:hypothetical protein